MKKAVFPGSFDPITLGHCEIIERGLEIFDQIILAIGINADKKYMFELSERKKFLEETFKNHPRIIVKTYRGLTVDFCKAEQAGFILRGLRNTIDLEFERSIAETNFKMAQIETVFLLASGDKAHISSTIVRDVMRNKGDYKFLVPSPVRINS